jgi:hypothetical protein
MSGRYPDLIPSRNAIYHRLHRMLPSARTLSCVDCGRTADEYDHPFGYEGENWKRVEAVCYECHNNRELSRGSKRHRKTKMSIIGPKMRDGGFFSLDSRKIKAGDRRLLKILEGPRMENGYFYSDQRA